MKKTAQGLIALKDILWAFAIVISLLAVLFGLLFAAFTGNRSARQDRNLDLSGVVIVDEGKAQEITDNSIQLNGNSGESTSKTTLQQTADAGINYLNSITFLVDSPLVAIANQQLPNGHVWISANGTMPMNSINTGTIVHTDGSKVNPDIAAMVAKPSILFIAIGNDSLTHVTEETFKANYKQLIESIHARSSQTLFICGSILPIGENYVTPDGLTNEMIRIANTWVQQVCEETGSYYCDIASAVTVNGALNERLTDNGKQLNDAGITTVISYVKTHSIS